MTTYKAFIFSLFAIFFSSSLQGADWPTFRGDQGRTGISSETTSLPLMIKWSYDSGQEPDSAWGKPAIKNTWAGAELSATLDFDRSFYPIVAGGKIFYSSSTTDELICLDGNAKRLWAYMADGPIRLAPLFSKGMIYFGSDDGFLYCVNADTGILKWKFLAGPKHLRLPGNGRIISKWPIRSGFIEADGVIHFSAGIFPNQGVYLCAVMAESGKLVWRKQIKMTTQGYCIASKTHLFVPGGRTPFHAFSIKEGKALGKLGFSNSWKKRLMGGSFGVLVGEQLASGPSEDAHFDLFDEKLKPLGRVKANQILVNGSTVYALQENKLLANTHSIFVNKKDKRRADASKSLLWNSKCEGGTNLVMSANHIFVACGKTIRVFDPKDGKQLFETKLEQTIEDLAISDGRIYLSTEHGWIHCLVEKQGKADSPTKIVRVKARKQEPAKGGKAFSDLETKDGYAFVLGLKDGSVISQVLRQTNFKIIAIDTDRKRIASLREKYDHGADQSRLSIQHFAGGALPYQKYIANLITSEKPTDELEAFSAKEIAKLLRPNGGVLLLDAKAKSNWGKEEFPGRKIAMLDGRSSIRWTRPALPGAGEWSHMYGNPANTACSNDTLAYSKLGMQWYGRPGPRNMVDRHGKQPPPLYKNGRLFVTGMNYFAALDGYNGTVLWEKHIPDSIRLGTHIDGSNMVATDDSLLVTTGEICREFDAQKGSVRHQYQISKLLKIDGKRNWGYIANVGNLLFGSSSADQALNRDPSLDNIKQVWGAGRPIVCSDAVFAIDRTTAKSKWTYQSKNGVIINPCIAIDGGKIVFVESESQPFGKLIKGRATLESLVKKAKLVALDIQTGKLIWQQSIDVTQIRDVLHVSIANGTIIMMGSNYRATTKDERRGLKKPDQEKRLRYHIFARSLKNGKELWKKEEVPVYDHILNGGHGENIQHPALVGDVLYGPGFAMHIGTGADYAGWKWAKAGNCGTISTSLNCAFSRKGNPMMYNLKSGSYSTVTESTRPGCWINIIPAGGMVLIPENSSGCSCEYSLQTSMALIPE